MFVRKIAHEGDFTIDSTCMTFDQICVIIASIKIENKTIKSDYVEKKGQRMTELFFKFWDRESLEWKN